jgi:RimJ/RimL family protein N-acetyltransferase
VKVFYELNTKKSFSSYNRNDEVQVNVRYYFQGKRIKVSTEVSVKIKDWDKNWRNRVSKEPIKSSDPQYKEKNLKIKGKLIEVRNTIENLEKDGLIPTTDLVKSHLRENKLKKIKKTLKVNKLDSRDIFISGNKVILKSLNEDDILHSQWYGWFNNEKVCSTLQKHYFPNSIELQKNFLNSISSQKTLILGICDIKYTEIIGVVSLSSINYINRSAEFSCIIASEEDRNVSVFVETLKLILKHAFLSLNLNKVYGGSISKNLVKLIVRVSNGKIEGVSRQEMFKNGEYHDTYNFSTLRDEFINLK